MSSLRVVRGLIGVAIALFTLGCPQGIGGVDGDGGTGGGSGGGSEGTGGGNGGTGGGTGGGGGGTDGGTGGGSGGGTGGGSGGGGGSDSRADAGMFSFGAMTGGWAGSCSSLSCERLISDVHGSSATNIYTTSEQGQIDHFNGSGAWTTVFNHTASSKRLHGIYVSPSGNVFAAGLNSLVHCVSNCVAQGDFVVTLNETGNSFEFYGVCGRGDDVYAVGSHTVGNGVIYKFRISDQTWQPFISDTGVSDDHKDCWVAPNGELFVSGFGRMIRVDNTQTAIVESITPPATPADVQIMFHDVWGAPSGEVFAVGRSRRVIRRPAGSSTWELTFSPHDPNGYETYAIFGAAPDEAWASGRATGNGQNFVRWNGAKWAKAGDGTININVHGMWAPNPDTYYFVGQAPNSYAGMVVRGTR